MERFHQWCRQQQQSRGLHGAALVNPPSDSPFWLAALDVGRHNAIDKVWGFCLRQGVAPRGRILLFSGRLSAEVLIKTAKMAVPVILSNAAPTSLGVELARSLGVTAAVVGHDALTVYSHPERIQGPTQLRTESTSSNPLP